MLRVAGGSGLELLARLGYAARVAVSLLVRPAARARRLGRDGAAATGSKGALQGLRCTRSGASLAAVALACSARPLRPCSRCWTPTGSAASRRPWWCGRAAVSALVHAGLGVFALSCSSAGAMAEAATRSCRRGLDAVAARAALRRWLVGAVGLAVAGAGFGMARKAWTASFMRRLACGPDQARWVVPLGRPPRLRAVWCSSSSALFWSSPPTIRSQRGGGSVAPCWHCRSSRSGGRCSASSRSASRPSAASASWSAPPADRRAGGSGIAQRSGAGLA